MLIVFLPAGSRPSEKDRQAWEYLELQFEIALISNFGRGAFARGAQSTSVYRLTHAASLGRLQRDAEPSSHVVPRYKRHSCVNAPVRIVRGGHQMHWPTATHKAARPLVHTINLVDGGVRFTGRRATKSTRSITGPAILIPRVGKPDPSKICLYLRRTPIVPSDCVFGLLVETPAEALAVQLFLREEFDTFQACYVGTGARFLTIRRLQCFLEKHGIAVEEHEP